MIKPPSWTAREEALLLTNAYLDGELDAAAILDVEQRMSADASLKAEYDRLVELRKSIASHVPKNQASGALRRRIEDLAGPVQPIVLVPQSRSRTYGWRQMAAAAVIAAGLASGATYLGLQPNSIENSVAAIVSGHQRALLAAAPFDVASSDRHTVKPWFDNKLALSPKVVELSEAGFPLAGGRIDVIGGQRVPALVYLRREHVISVIAVPRNGSADSGAAPSRSTRDGYTVLGWSGRDFMYSAVSDVAETELNYFVRRWRAEAQAN
jgi:anti-sigma factor RsiW